MDILITKTKIVSHEIAYTLVGERKGAIWHVRFKWKSIGTPVSVSFDWEKVMLQEEKRKNVLGFFHTHPSGMSAPSSRDDRTMEAWSRAFGKPLLCAIGCDDQTRVWIYDRDRSKVEVREVEVFKSGWMVVSQ